MKPSVCLFVCFMPQQEFFTHTEISPFVSEVQQISMIATFSSESYFRHQPAATQDVHFK
jgi:hypothetical protein